ncbi:MAG: ParB/RepB/Spo0J family partition protein [Halocynthiibacter sp.]
MKHQKIQTPELNTAQKSAELVPLTDLYLSDLNPRQEVSEEGIQQLADSILACGLIQNLAGLRDEMGKVGIVAGGRRLRALELAAKDDIELALVPVRIAPDAETALQWANAENSARADLDPADEIRAYGKMAANDAPIAQISKVFAVSEAHVRRRLALAHLPEQVLDAVKAGALSLEHAKIMTTSGDKAKILEALERATNGNWFSEHDLRNILTPEAVSGTDRIAIYVGEEAYTGAGGKLTRDLFEDKTLFENPEILSEAFTAKLEAEAEAIRTEQGWAWVETITEHYISYAYRQDRGLEQIRPEEGTLNEEQTLRYDELAELLDADAGSEADNAEFEALEAILGGEYSETQKALAGIVAYVDYDAKLCIVEAYVRPEQKEDAIAAGILSPDVKGEATAEQPRQKPEYNQKFLDDMQAIRLGALQTAILEKPELALDLLGFAISPNSGDYSRTLGLSLNGEATSPSIVEGYEHSPRIGGDLSEEERKDRRALADVAWDDLPTAFARFQEAGKKYRNAQITQFIARAVLTQKTGLMEVLEESAGANIREIWTPNAENCFKRLNARQLDELYADLRDLELTDEQFRSFAKSKKGEKVAGLHNLFNDQEYRKALHLSDDQEAKIAAWVPDCF